MITLGVTHLGGHRYRVDPGMADALGRERRGAHDSDGGHQFFKDSAAEHIRGIKVELAFEAESGIEVDLSVLPGGDGLKDFVFEVGGKEISIDVKGATKPYNLFLKQKKAEGAADILVLAGIYGDEVEFVGWEHKSIMLLCPVRDAGYGILNHVRPASELRPMEQLKKLIEMPDE